MTTSRAAGATDLGRRLREQREQAGFSQADAARAAGMSPQYLAFMESNPNAYPTQATLIRLAAALGTSVAALGGAGLNLPPGQRDAANRPVMAELSAEECRALIAPGGVGRVLFVEEARGPVAIPVNYRMDGTDVVFRTGSGGMLDASMEQASVSFDVDHLDEALSEGWSVLLTGTASVVTEAAEIERAAALRIEPWAGGDRPTYVRLRPRQITGRAIRVRG
jgi:nitroimidazol reductase NimA-like FMN-containing flavoprotein (pyridoxamine 5'-phosphate oxidase superfamily)/DNA-binding XRE family transcriptional regulator